MPLQSFGSMTKHDTWLKTYGNTFELCFEGVIEVGCKPFTWCEECPLTRPINKSYIGEYYKYYSSNNKGFNNLIDNQNQIFFFNKTKKQMINDQLCRTWDLSKTFESICNLQVVATSQL
jgi:hypothetical protein